MEKLMIIDGNSILYRAFFSLPLTLTNGEGVHTNAVYGFTNMFLSLKKEIQPDKVVVAFDKSKKTFRNEKFAEYKGTRKATPDELGEQFPIIRNMLSAMGVTYLEVEGFEADDIIGTLAKQASGNYEVIIISGDRDVLQLVDDDTNVKVMLTKKGVSELETYDNETVFNKFGVSPTQIPDLKGLTGDTSDNIPGVAGVGEKTAAKLITEYGTVENLMDNIENVSGKKVKENLTAGKENGILSKELATIFREVPINIDFSAYTQTPNKDELFRLLEMYKFKSFVKKINEF